MSTDISSILALTITTLAAYLLGAVPIARLVASGLFGADLSSAGSGNYGATNALRVVGPAAGGLILAADVIKGILAALIPGLLFPNHPEIQAIAALAAVIGHNWSVFNRFTGGRGVATGIGAGLVIYPVVVVVAVVAGVALVVAIRYVSLGSLLGTLIAVVLAFTLYFTGLWQSPWGMIYVGLGSALIIWRHFDNLKRLLAGNELQLAAWPTYFKRSRSPRQ